MKYKEEIKLGIIIIVAMIVITVMMIWFVIAFDSTMQFIFGNMFTSSEYQTLGVIIYILSLLYVSKNLFK